MNCSVDPLKISFDVIAISRFIILAKNNKDNGRSRKRGVDAHHFSDNIDEEEEQFDYGEDFQPSTEFSWPAPGETEIFFWGCHY